MFRSVLVSVICKTWISNPLSYVFVYEDNFQGLNEGNTHSS